MIFGVDFIRHPGIIATMIMNCINTLRLNHDAMRFNRLLCAGMALGMLSACTAMQQPAGPSVAAPHATGSHFVMADGYQLPYTQSAPMDPRAVVIALHGFNDHRRAWAEPATRWSGQGIAVYAYDQRGFGETENRGIWPGVPTLTRDLASVVAMVQARHPDLPVHLVGESMGGAVVMAALGSPEPPRVASAVLSAPAVWSRKTMTGLARWALDFFSSAMPGYTATGGGLGVRASDNDMVLRAMGADPLFIKATRFDTVSGLVDLMDAAYNAVPAIRTPLLVLYGRRDQIVPCQAVEMTLARFHTEPDLALYDEGWHLLFRDLQGPVVQHDVGRWLLQPDAALPSGSGGGTVADLCAQPDRSSRLASANG
ncbi:MAG: alpha/beta hydrolase [Minwuia thermotolerans]|nr:MAG: alpha/beta hydrolase [Minwuia thermotolerans]